MSRWVLLGIVIFLLSGIFAMPRWSPEQEHAIEIAREYFEDMGHQPGKVFLWILSIDTKCLIADCFTGEERRD